MKRCLLVRLISSPDEAIDPLPASPKSDYLTIEYASQVFIVVRIPSFHRRCTTSNFLGYPLSDPLPPCFQFPFPLDFPLHLYLGEVPAGPSCH